MSSKRLKAVTLAAVAALAPWGCDDGSNVGPATPVATVSVTPSTSTLAPGGTVQLQAVTKDAAGTTLTDRKIVWSSSDNAIATVSAAGLVTGVADGTATITATSEGQSGSAVVTVATPPALTALAVSDFHTCALTSAGAAYCWGVNGVGQLGDGSTTSSLVPVAVSGGLSFSAVATGYGHTCGLTSSGAAYCWGWNDGGQLGNGSTASSSTPIPVSGNLTFSIIAPAFGIGSPYMCGLTSSGLAYCWGASGVGGLGTGSEPMQSSIPVAVVGGHRFSALDAGGGHNCGLTSSGAAYCWGLNREGQLGSASTATVVPMPVAVSGGQSFSAIAVGGLHTCGMTSSGTAYCWGSNDGGQLGNGSLTNSSIPVAVSEGQSFSALSAGGFFTCGLTSSGTAYCWGRNDDGQLGNGSTTNSSTPVAVSGGLSFSALATGSTYTCGLTSSGVAYCWGRNDEGQLGNGTTDNSNVPVRVADH